MPRELDLRAWGGFLGWRPQHVSTLAHQLYKQLHAKDRGEPALYLAPHPTPGTTERTFRSCGEQMGDDSICVGFLDRSQSSCQGWGHSCTHLGSSGSETAHPYQWKDQGHTLSAILLIRGPTPRGKISSGTQPVPSGVQAALLGPGL